MCSYTARIKQKTEFALVAGNYLGESVEESLEVDIRKENPLIHAFLPEGPRAIEGYPFELQWKVEGAETVRLKGPDIDLGLPLEGRHAIHPQTSGTYNLIANGFFEERVLEQLFIPVEPVPRIENLKLPEFPSISLPKIPNTPRPTPKKQRRSWWNKWWKREVPKLRPPYTPTLPHHRLGTMLKMVRQTVNDPETLAQIDLNIPKSDSK